jgi:hypothetical protein
MQTRNPAQRRYLWRFLPAMAAYMVVLIAAERVIDSARPTGVALALLSVAPALPLVAAIAAIGLYLHEERDEWVRARAAAASLGATGLLLALATVWGFLEQGGVVAHVPAWAAFPLWAIGLGLSQGVLALADRRAGGGGDGA